jgi:adenine-specific DNA methylase
LKTNNSIPSSTHEQNILSRAFIEKNQTIDWLYKLAMMEANSKRPIYQIHKWWARRLGSVFRTLLISSFSDSIDSAETIYSRYNNGHSLTGKLILDPFMGGGTTVIEGLKLGCKVIGVDINPVAWFVTKKEADNFDVEEAQRTFSHLESSVGNRIKHFYHTECLHGHPASVLYVLWVQKIKCAGCEETTQLFRNYTIATKGKLSHVFCPDCQSIMETETGVNPIKCKECNREFDPAKGVVFNGQFKCPHCGQTTKITAEASRLGEPLSAEIFAIEYYCPVCKVRQFKKPSDEDLILYNEAVNLLQTLQTELPIPSEKIPSDGRDSKRPLTHGYKRFSQLFNDRQLLCLGLLYSEIMKIPNPNMREFFVLAFSNSLETNNRLCKYESNWRKISALFGIPGYHPVERYAENNVWGNGLGRGTFEKSFKKLLRGKIYANDTYERVYHKNEVRPFHSGETAQSIPASDFTELLMEKNTIINCGDSQNLSFIPNESIDGVLTDPPYFDSIHYSGLADFFYVWLRLALKQNYTCFEPPYCSRTLEIVAKDCSNEEMLAFTDRLSNVFSECKRVLKKEAIMVFTFHHTNSQVWLAVKNAIEAAGLVVVAAPVTRSEGRTGYRKKGSINVDACIVCRKDESAVAKVTTNLSLEEVIVQCTSIAQELAKADGSLREPDLFTLLMAQGLLSDRYTFENIVKNSKDLLAQLMKMANPTLENSDQD